MIFSGFFKLPLHQRLGLQSVAHKSEMIEGGIVHERGGYCEVISRRIAYCLEMHNHGACLGALVISLVPVIVTVSGYALSS